jgi:hypothetical protein
LGTKVGYSIRFENCTGPRTRLKFLTDGSLMRELCTFSDFNPYGVVILDEAHERSLSTVSFEKAAITYHILGHPARIFESKFFVPTF